MAKRHVRYFKVNGKWIPTQKFADMIGVKSSTVRHWISQGVYSKRMKQYLGYVPLTTKDKWLIKNENEIFYAKRRKRKRNYIVYKTDNLTYQYGICIGYGNTKEEAVKDFLKSRKDSELPFEVIYISDKHEKAAKVYEKVSGKEVKPCGLNFKKACFK